MNCENCKENICIAISEIWDGKTFFRLSKDIVDTFRKCQLEYILLSLSMKDYWDQSDIRAKRYIERRLKCINQ